MKKSDYPEWEMYARLLTKEEQADPLRVLDDVFDFAHLPEWRVLLWEWLKITVSSTYHTEAVESERTTILLTYEKLQKLLEVAYLMYIQLQSLQQKDQEKQRHIF
ncbi:MAG: hypothetical protein IBJ16_03740 [Chitinophagaceae bacterium]|nr:hypothetical protein [Chitinophagaceae bacterium]